MLKAPSAAVPAQLTRDDKRQLRAEVHMSWMRQLCTGSCGQSPRKARKLGHMTCTVNGISDA